MSAEEPQGDVVAMAKQTIDMVRGVREKLTAERARCAARIHEIDNALGILDAQCPASSSAPGPVQRGAHTGLQARVDELVEKAGDAGMTASAVVDHFVAEGAQRDAVLSVLGRLVRRHRLTRDGKRGDLAAVYRAAGRPASGGDDG